MNFLLNDYLAKLVNSQKGVTVILGNVNGSIIPASANTKAMEITNTQGNDVHVVGMAVRYNSTFDDVLIEIFNAQQNKKIVSGSVPLVSVGVEKTRVSQFSFFPIIPFVLISGNFVDVNLNNVTANPLPARGVSVSLIGIQSV